MATSLDVMNQVAALLGPVVYPNGTGQPSVTNAPITIYPGWPTQAALDNALAANPPQSVLSIFTAPGGANTTRYPQNYQRIGEPSAATLTWAVLAITATLCGTVSTPQNVAIIVDDIAYAYAVQANDTLTTIAAALATLIAVNRSCTSAGPVITIPNAVAITARVGTVSTVAAELSRQKKRFQITAWCATPAIRAAIVSAIMPAFAALPFISMPDGFAARMRYADDFPQDTTQKALLYRHDLIYEVEYATTNTTSAAQAIVWTIEVFGGVIPPKTNPQIFNF
jgi:hypothetical protein